MNQITNVSNGWLDSEIDLSDYSGERVYIGFNLTSDVSVARDGWYIDDVGLSDNSIGTAKVDTPVRGGAMLGVNQGGYALGVVDNSLSKKDSEAVNPAKIMPLQPIEKAPKEDKAISPQVLPIGATVNVLESGRSVNTNPADGSYSLLHAAGEFTVVAGAYGYHSNEQSVVLEADGTATANFVLDELDQYTVSGTRRSNR